MVFHIFLKLTYFQYCSYAVTPISLSFTRMYSDLHSSCLQSTPQPFQALFHLIPTLTTDNNIKYTQVKALKHYVSITYMIKEVMIFIWLWLYLLSGCQKKLYYRPV